MFAGDVLLSNMKQLSNIDENKLAILVERYGAEQLLNEGFSKKKLAALIGAGIIAGSSLIDLPKNCSNKEDNKIEYNNPYGINNIDYENIVNKEKLVKDYISDILSKHGKTLSDLKFNPNNLVIASYQYEYDLPLLLAQLQIESHFGTTERARRTNSMFSIGAYDDGRDVVKYANQDSSIIPFIKIIKRDYLMNGEKEVDQLLQNFVNYNGHRYASNPKYESELAKTRNSIISKYPDLLNDYVCLDQKNKGWI
jgi:hypothetical protein